MSQADNTTEGPRAERKQSRSHEDVERYVAAVSRLSGEIQAIADGMAAGGLVALSIDGVTKIDRGLGLVMEWLDHAEMAYKRATRPDSF
jgi:hypothetical protein